MKEYNLSRIKEKRKNDENVTLENGMIAQVDGPDDAGMEE